MELIQEFSNYLINSKGSSTVTAKNYKADIAHFLSWLQTEFQKPIQLHEVTPQIIDLYKKSCEKSLSLSTLKRYSASLRQFFRFLEIQQRIPISPFLAESYSNNPKEAEPGNIDEFKRYLQNSNLSRKTVKNYILDIQKFVNWCENVLQHTDIFNHINSSLIGEYKNRLVDHSNLSPVSVNRKLSSLRKYINWAYEQNLFKLEELKLHNIDLPKENDLSSFVIHNETLLPSKQKYSPFPPVRLIQKTLSNTLILFDSLITIPIINAYFSIYNTYTVFTKKTVFKNTSDSYTEIYKKDQNASIFLNIPNIKKEFYAPLALSTTFFPWHKKLWHTIRYKRPLWYKRYHSYPIVHYLHFCILIICMSMVGLSLYREFSREPQAQQSVLSERITSVSHPLAFKGKLLDSFGNPITTPTNIRVLLYNHPTASGSALVWEEVQNVKPDTDGLFSIFLGTNNPLPDSSFQTQGQWVGISIEENPEMVPRQQLPNVSYATNADLIQGLAPITQPYAGTQNVLLALNSAGNLTIGGSASPTFQATGGSFTLMGQSLTLASNPGSSGNIEISPDGSGMIDFQKPIFNSSNNNNIPQALGAVEIDDSFAILATTSGQSAFILNQNGLGPLISASSAGIAKFTVDNNGNTYLAGNLGIGTASPSALLEAVGGKMNILQNSSIANSPGYDLNIVGKTDSIYNYPHLAVVNQQNVGTSLAKVSAITGNSAIKGSFVADYHGQGTGNDFESAGFDSPGVGILVYSNYPFMVKTNNQERLRITNDGNIGIGTSTPLFKLDVTDSKSSTAAAMITNTDNGSTANVLQLKLGTTTPGSNNHFLSFLNGSGSEIGSIRGNGSGGITYATSGVDFAEYFKKSAAATNNFSAGTIVCIDSDGGVNLCSSQNQQIVGVVSDRPGFVGGSTHSNDPNYVLVGLVGQLPVNVSGENGPIKPGDSLSISSITGLAAKATKTGYIVGHALEPYSGQGTGIISASIQVSWYDPSIFITATGNLSIVPANSKAASVTATYSLQDAVGTIIQTTQALSNLLVANIQAGIIIAEKINTQEIVAPIARFDQIHTNIISPLAADTDFVIQLGPSSQGSTTLTKLEVKNASGSAIASIDSLGNAQFSGSISAQAASFSGSLTSSALHVDTNATIDGILRARKIIADQIEGAVPDRSMLSFSDLQTNFLTSASLSGQLTMINNLQSTFATFTQGLISLGPSSFSNVSVTDQLSIGSPTGGILLADNGINVLGSTLEIQPLKQGAISFLGGLIFIDVDGTLQVKGSAQFLSDVSIKGKLSAHIISPLPSEDIAITLPSSAEHDSILQVKNASGSAILAVNQAGDIIASGSAFINKLNFHIIAPALAISETEAIASSSAGIATISATQRELTIKDPLVTSDSLIYVTPRGIAPYPLYLKRQDPGVSFTIGVEQQPTDDIPFNWMIVN